MDDFDLRTLIRWLIYGVLGVIGLSLLGVLIDVATALLTLALKAGVVVLVVLFVAQFLEGTRT